MMDENLALTIHDIPFDMSKLYSTVSKKVYKKDLITFGCSVSYRLSPINDEEYYLLPLHRKALLEEPLPCTYNFIIRENKGYLELILGFNHHYYLNECNFFVKAAGTLSFNNKNISKMTLESGGYHLESTDKFYAEKVKSILKALKLVGLPLKKLVCNHTSPNLIKESLIKLDRVPCIERPSPYPELIDLVSSKEPVLFLKDSIENDIPKNKNCGTSINVSAHDVYTPEKSHYFKSTLKKRFFQIQTA